MDQETLDSSPEWQMVWLLALAVAIALASGFAIRLCFGIGALEAVLNNRLSPDQYKSLFLVHTASFAATGALYLLSCITASGSRQERIIAGVSRCNDYLFVVLLLPVAAGLAAPAIETKAPFFTLFLCALSSGIVARWLFLICKRHSSEAPEATNQSRFRFSMFATGAAFIGFSVQISQYAIENIRNFQVPSFDLAIYNNLLWNAGHGEFLKTSLLKGGTHLGAHCDPILMLFAPLYMLAPGPETLLILQTVWLASGVFPLYLLTARVFERELPRVATIAIFLLHPAAAGILLYEFHSLALAVPLLMWLVYAIEANWKLRYWLLVALILLTREDMALLLCGVGLYLAAATPRKQRGLLTIALSLMYLSIVKQFLMAEPGLFMSGQNDSYAYAKSFREMIPQPQGGAFDFAATLLTNPVFALKTATTEPKLLYLLIMFLPVGFLTLGGGRRLLLLVYGMVFTLLSSEPQLHSPYYQYNSVIVPFVIMLFPIGASALLKHERVSLIPKELILFPSVLTLAICVSIKFGAFVPNTAFRSGSWPSAHMKVIGNPEQHQQDFAALMELLPEIPPDASVSASRYLLPYVSTRAAVWSFPKGKADYFLVHDFRLDTERRKHLNRMLKDRNYTLLARRAGLWLIKRND